VSTFWIYALSGLVVSWPPALAAMGITLYLANRKVAQANDAQTAKIARMTDAQTVKIGEIADAQTRELLAPGAGTAV
jgi:hypothetical protein